MKRKILADDVCPVARSLDAVGDTWSMLIVRQAFAGERRFGEFEKSLGVAKNILTVRLRKPVLPLAFHARLGRELGAGDMELVSASGF